MSKKKKKKNQTKAKRGREKTCDGKLKKSNTQPNRINPKYYCKDSIRDGPKTILGSYVKRSK